MNRGQKVRCLFSTNCHTAPVTNCGLNFAAVTTILTISGRVDWARPSRFTVVCSTKGTVFYYSDE